ncbi:unnamed protein product [Ostreobium quekettii]|uniref:Uncharacterized protein n=1 Tax=Ostreobium quekettii TaxID=121088 RepID=A0A8S1IMS9_9CHLO|nr:unnamed protein product [Ostreobium quekettii]|eukprot:evm.model.scf_283.6 EVM.evm.TU.scf_283.6   scf_283:74007-75308(-)
MLDAVDAPSFNLAAVLWETLSEVPLSERARLLDVLAARDIVKLWRIAGERYEAAGRGKWGVPGHAVADDFPEEPGEVSTFDGKAALAWFPWFGVDRFKKCFFLDSSYNLFGHLVVNRGPLGELLYPTYFQASCDLATIPATGEVADIRLDYLPVNKLNLKEELPIAGWRPPGDPRFPFGGGLVDYMRVVAPGVYVGVGWKAPKKKRDLGRRFLYFVLVKRVAD